MNYFIIVRFRPPHQLIVQRLSFKSIKARYLLDNGLLFYIFLPFPIIFVH
jgi:hypothetical protein